MPGLRAMRRRRALSRVELGRRVGVTPAAIANYESGKRVPDYPTCQRLGSALGVKWSTIHEAAYRAKRFRSEWEPKIEDVRDRMRAIAEDATRDDELRRTALRVVEEFEAALQVEVAE